MTNEEAFRVSADGLLEQGCVSTAFGQAPYLCRYRGAEGRKCALGFLIPDEEYDASMENAEIGTLKKSCPSLQGLNEKMLQRLQSIHDRRSPQKWRDELRKMAVKWGFNWTPPQAEEART